MTLQIKNIVNDRARYSGIVQSDSFNSQANVQPILNCFQFPDANRKSSNPDKSKAVLQELLRDFRRKG